MPAAALDRPAAIDDLVLYRMNRVLATAGTMVIRLCEGRFGITRREWRVMAQLGDGAELLSSQLADKAQLDRARTSRAVTTLVAKGLVRRHTGEADRRQARVSLTPQGQALYGQLFPLVREINQGLLAPLDAAAVRQLEQALQVLQAQADQLVAVARLPKADRHRGGRAPRGV